ncbi:hypothetical protein M9H77_32424 [Catharanthus roseus]|uniref:Uncharacterized protein n=1 Tax=Catharanthus roseus TaxID=4058 RepID=A0ACC0A447_CATRO|nr:hypothetical protein M9H77_32424 [Catharanthus roseus]
MASCARILHPTARSLPNCLIPLCRSFSLTFPSAVAKPLPYLLRQHQKVINLDSKKLDFRAKASMAGVSTKKSRGKVQVFDSEEELAVSLAKYVADLSDKVGKERNAFTVVISGGSLSIWHVFWVDERVVPKNNPESNYFLAYNDFLSKIPIPSGHVYAINDALSAEGAADDYETCIKHLVKSGTIGLSEASGFPKFDLMLLGMGPDGHVASLFPGHPLAQESEKWVTFIEDSPKPPPERITFTFPVINSSAHLALVVAGSGKADVVHTVLGDGKKHDTLPVQLVLPEGGLTWFLDKGAASKI